MSEPGVACETCPAARLTNLQRLGVSVEGCDYVVALAGNPNTGKSTVFNALTGLRQHTGNWPGKTVTRAEGSFSADDKRFKLVDLPGTYSLLATSQDEEVARNFILFAQPDVTVVVVDATCLERNLNLVLQILEITDRVVICLNLMDEAERKGLEIDARRLARDLGVPVIPTSARYRDGLEDLVRTVGQVARGEVVCRPHRIATRTPSLQRAVTEIADELETRFTSLPNARWVALRLLDADQSIEEAVRNGELGELFEPPDGTAEVETSAAETEALFERIDRLRWKVGGGFHQALVETVYTEAARLTDRAVHHVGAPRRFDLDRTIDGIVTSRRFGFPVMLLLLTLVFWVTVSGANVPSAMLATLFIDTLHPLLKSGAAAIGLPWWLDGLLIDGMYLSTAWVVAVMLPPMAIFFPLFTLLEDFGYLPRVAFNLDNLFRRAGAQGKQALTMAMGFGCNAAAIVSTRIIDSPRERLVAIITNNFALCNGRWPTQILVASIFIGALAPAYLAGLVSALAVVGVAVLGILLTFATSWLLSRTALRGEVSAFSLELPPYRPPRFWQTVYTSIIDRTLIVLWRALIFALPAGGLIWLLANVKVSQLSLAEWTIGWFDPLGALIGLSGVILLAYVIAIPANEIVIPTVLMLTVLAGGFLGVGEGAGVMFELASADETGDLLRAGGWTLLTAINLMLFSLVHNPCSTTIYTIWKETRSAKWTTVAALLPLVMGFALCFFVAQIWRLVGNLVS